MNSCSSVRVQEYVRTHQVPAIWYCRTAGFSPSLAADVGPIRPGMPYRHRPPALLARTSAHTHKHLLHNDTSVYETRISQPLSATAGKFKLAWDGISILMVLLLFRIRPSEYYLGGTVAPTSHVIWTCMQFLLSPASDSFPGCTFREHDDTCYKSQTSHASAASEAGCFHDACLVGLGIGSWNGLRP